MTWYKGKIKIQDRKTKISKKKEQFKHMMIRYSSVMISFLLAFSLGGVFGIIILFMSCSLPVIGLVQGEFGSGS